MPDILNRVDRRRLSGWKRPGGLYLVSDDAGRSCGRLPIVCNVYSIAAEPHIAHSRYFQWAHLKDHVRRRRCTCGTACHGCPCSNEGLMAIPRVGVLWVNRVAYETPDVFTREALLLGIALPIRRVPRGFCLGETWVALAHWRAITKPIGYTWAVPSRPQPGLFRLFKPTRIEYAVRGDETPERLRRLARRGVTLVRVERGDENILLFQDNCANEKRPNAPSPYEDAPGPRTQGGEP